MKETAKVVPLNWVNKVDRWIVVPGTIKENGRLRVKEVPLCKKNCFFASGVPKSIIDFIYRCVVQLDLKDKKLFFSRGTVRNKRSLLKYSVSIHELNWGVGTLITIPRILKYKEKINYIIDKEEFSFRIMELIILQGLLKIVYPEKDKQFHKTMSALILAKGWGQIEQEDPPSLIKD